MAAGIAAVRSDNHIRPDKGDALGLSHDLMDIEAEIADSVARLVLGVARTSA
jgi:hypothetical protein